MVGWDKFRLLTRPPQLAVGWLLIAIFWPLNWTLPGNPTAYLFFPLWLGYILVVDGLVLRRTGSSLWTRSPREFAGLFLLSAPAWWLFEFINRRTGNWEYLGDQHFSDFEYVLLCSISFSTVMPAVFETAELVSTFPWVQRFSRGWRITPSRALQSGLLLAGLVMLTLTMLWPRLFYPCVWLAVVLILEPINAWLGRRHFLEHLARGDWRIVLSLSLGALLCGFFWEMWNYWSYPKWIYHTPGAQFAHLFEMPLLGYGGYLPFAWELYSLRNLVWPGAGRMTI